MHFDQLIKNYNILHSSFLLNSRSYIMFMLQAQCIMQASPVQYFHTLQLPTHIISSLLQFQHFAVCYLPLSYYFPYQGMVPSKISENHRAA